VFDAASVLIPYHIFLAAALIGTAVVGAVIRAIAKKMNPSRSDQNIEFAGMFVLLVVYVISTVRG
jgi:hypothetical protein